jgi:hypothetical protein
MGAALGLVAAVAMVAFSTEEARADRRDFTLKNNGSTTISRLYVSCADGCSWGGDVLGADVLYPGESVPITFSGFSNRCYYDIKVVNSRGSASFLWGVNLCNTSTVTYR